MDYRTLPPYRHINWSPGNAELRKFGLVMLIGSLLAGGLLLLRSGGQPAGALFLALFGLLCFAASFARGPGLILYRLVYLATGLLGFVISHLILTVIFFGLFTPLGLLLRWLGKDLLRLRPGEKSGWIPARPRDNRSYYRQY